jgi:hypothetical protein
MYIVLIILIIAVIASVSVLIYWKATNQMFRYWEIVRYFKRRDVRPHMDSIRNINESLKVNNSTIQSKNTQKGFFNAVKHSAEKAYAKGKGAIDKIEYKKVFDTHKNAYQAYLEFCQSKNLSLSAEEEAFTPFIDETEDLLYPEKALDRQLQKANDEYDKTYAVFSAAGKELFQIRSEAVETIDQVSTFINSLAKHPKEFDTDISEISQKKEEFKKAIDFAKEEHKKLKQSAVGVGTGAAAGAAVASMAPTAAMWVATTFGTASTGTAISALSGAAATNAALAWLGGGALAAGVGGMAAGQALLALAGPVGWGLAGVSIFTSVLLFWRKKRKIQESKKQEIERMKNCTFALKELKAKIESIQAETIEFHHKLKNQLADYSSLSNQDYTTFTKEQKTAIGAIVNNTKSLSVLISKVLS